MSYNTQKSEGYKVPDDLNIVNSPPPSAAVMAAMARNHFVVATSTSCDSAQVARSVEELESGRFSGLCPEVDLWLHQRHMKRDQARYQ